MRRLTVAPPFFRLATARRRRGGAGRSRGRHRTAGSGRRVHRALRRRRVLLFQPDSVLEFLFDQQARVDALQHPGGRDGRTRGPGRVFGRRRAAAAAAAAYDYETIARHGHDRVDQVVGGAVQRHRGRFLFADAAAGRRVRHRVGSRAMEDCVERGWSSRVFFFFFVPVANGFVPVLSPTTDGQGPVTDTNRWILMNRTQQINDHFKATPH